MIKVSINYAGNIPGLGRGPFMNIAISATQLRRLKSIGYPVRVLEIPKKEFKNTVVKEKEEIQLKPVPTKPICENKQEEQTNVEEKEEITVVASEENSETVVTEEETVSENKEASSVSEEDLYSKTIEELDAMLSPSIKRPVKYGKPWLIKNIKAQVG